MLEALFGLCREAGVETLRPALEQHAPTWLVQMPSLLSAEELEALQRRVFGATQERMLREMTAALEALTVDLKEARALLEQIGQEEGVSQIG